MFRVFLLCLVLCRDRLFFGRGDRDYRASGPSWAIGVHWLSVELEQRPRQVFVHI